MKFAELIKTDPHARKIFGRKEIEIILKQLDGIPLTQSESNRLSRDIRPKLGFIEKCLAFKDYFSLKKNQENKMILKETVSQILTSSEGYKVSAILLFGSHARRTPHKRSDLDVAVIFKEIREKDGRLFLRRMLKITDQKIELHLFNFLPSSVRGEIAKNSKILYKRKDFKLQLFMLSQLKEYFERNKQLHSNERAY
ncbi:nucleotidyltransferase domain-containing protein [Candidatus Woesearchaeota archaeon]|nr:nucleotidyltransferase domain-containing protein [Candidatus Woesearchaeota archaeon]HLC80386.1 nucleotidyltransferase domain-containing protein [Candidatus Nanoarchaeia archaeon]